MSLYAKYRLHSTYNPLAEAQRFLDAQEIDFNPYYIVITEPAESWLSEPLRKKFPKSKIIALRYTSDLFLDSDYLWDFVWRINNKTSVFQFLFNIISEDLLSLTYFCSWPPSDKIWSIEAQEIWQQIKILISTQKSVMYTRHYFGPVWLKNIIHNSLYTQRFYNLLDLSCPILITASGPSLENLFPIDPRLFFIITVSSAYECLKAQNITPDLCMATDGGFWALEYLRNIPHEIPIAFSLESAIPKKTLETNPSLLLNYGSLLEKVIFNRLHFNGEKAIRNGSVSGTASLFSFEKTTNNVFISGLDLQTTLSKTHCSPHIRTYRQQSFFSRLTPQSHSLFEESLDNRSLVMYKQWFSSRNSIFKDRFFRTLPVINEIEGIKTVNLNDFSFTPIEKSSLFYESKSYFNLTEKNTILKNLLFSLSESSLEAINDSNIDPINFISSIEGEFISLLCYTDYLNFLKKISIQTTFEKNISLNEIKQKITFSIEKWLSKKSIVSL